MFARPHVVRPVSEKPKDAFHLLLECHERIRTFMDLAVKVARLPDAPGLDRGEALERVERFFTEVFPLHVEDEDVSLAHRLWEAGPSQKALGALEDMTWQHRELEALLRKLVPRWRQARTSPGLSEELTREWVRDSEWFAGLMEAHLWLEERVLFPEARARLSAASVKSLGAEMRARHGPARVARAQEP